MTPHPTLRLEDLAPGDRAAIERAPVGLRAQRVRDASDPDFLPAYQRLWDAFGSSGGMERREVIEDRLRWDPARPLPHAALAYDLLVLRRGEQRVALRDHTAVVRREPRGRPVQGPVVVHLSHAFVEPAHRGAGLAAWLRALPLETGRRCAQAAGLSEGVPIVLVAEMEPPDSSDAMRGVRLRSYERAGFRKIDPAAAPYAQPDFRAPEEIASTSPRPVPLSLVVRRVGREDETSVSAEEVAAIVEGLYTIYGVHVPSAALEPLRQEASRWTTRQRSFRLLPPTR